jgi:hypothetical protein
MAHLRGKAVIALNNSPDRWFTVPIPADAKLKDIRIAASAN